MVAIKESKAFRKQQKINFLQRAITQVEKQLNNFRAGIKTLTHDLTILRGMLKDEKM